MNLQRVFALVKKNLLTIIREPSALFLLILFPIVCTLLFGISYGKLGGSQTTSYQIGIVNMDLSGSYSQWSQHLIGNLTRMEFLNIQYYSSNETAQNDLIQGKIQAVLIIPSNFGESCNSFWRAPVSPSLWVNTTVQLYLDSGSIFATQAIPPIIQQVIATTIYGEQPALVTPIKIGSPSLIQANKLTTYDYFAPGIFAFSTIFSIMTVASSFALEHEKGLLRRINTTPTAPTEIIVSQAVSNMIVAMIQVAIVFIMSFIVGYRPQGNVLVVVPAFIFLSIFSLCCVGFGLISAIIGKSPGAANGLSFIFTLPLMFLGTYITIGLSPTVQSLGKVVPSYYVTDALTSLLLRGAPIFSPTVLVDFAAVSIYSIIVLVIGIVLFRKYSKD